MKKNLYILLIVILCAAKFSAQTEEKTSSSQSMLQASAISVTIGGHFIITGTFPAFLNERVDAFVTRMYNQAKVNALSRITDPKLLMKVEEQLKNYSLRDIMLKRADGKTMKLDLLKFRLTGDFAYDPYLQNDDILIFPAIDLKTTFFTVSGAVNNPGKFPFVQGDKLSDALMFAQGINKSYANVTKAAINRLSWDGTKMTVDTVAVDSDVPLQSGDRIVVLSRENEKRVFNAIVIGEVNSPGEIPITKDNTTIRQVIEKAGGFTSNASMTRARIYPGSMIPMLLEKEYGIKLKNQMDLLDLNVSNILMNLETSMMFRMSNLTEDDTAYFFLENYIKALDNGSSIDFGKIFNKDYADGNYIVNDGDIIIVPPKDNSVYVYGQVARTGSVTFVPGKDYMYYINEAGGLGEYATSGIMVIKARSRQWVNPRDKKVDIEPGDYIWVPKEQFHEFRYYVREAASYFSIVASVATIVLLVLQFRK